MMRRGDGGAKDYVKEDKKGTGEQNGWGGRRKGVGRTRKRVKKGFDYIAKEKTGKQSVQPVLLGKEPDKLF